MHLQSLELFGFKSFADKTIFNFHEGVTAIVGPNGCGKSNVLDAVRWVLGEQSAKALRGGEMADVIFNGTDTRKPVGFGEVSLTFSDCASELGVDWHDVRVTRRVYRDGNSEYLLNKTLCRLRDIQSLFADTGVGRSAYSIMEQGKIDLILSSRPEDRRAVFEEAAGITKYKTQKREALRKLEATEANLLRIGDIIKEVKRQIGSLQRQAGKARRYQALMADLQVLDTHHSRRQLENLERELEQSRNELKHLAERERATHEKIEASENELSAKRQQLDAMDSQIADVRADVQRLQSEMAAHRSRIEFNRQRAEELAELIERYERDIAAAETKRGEQETQIQEADALIEKTNLLLQTKQNEAEALTEKLRMLRTERVTNEEDFQAAQLSLSKSESRLSALQDELNGIAGRRDATLARMDELDAAVRDADKEASAARKNLSFAQRTLEDEHRAAERLLADAATAEAQLHDAQRVLADADKATLELDRTFVEKRSRLDVLRQLTEEGEGLEEGSQAVLKGLHDPERIRPALGGTLVASLNVDREFIPALEAAFGRNMHAVVLQDADLAREIFVALSENKLGHAALAIPQLAARSDAVASRLRLPEGAICWAIDKVDVSGSLAPLVNRLLSNVAIVPDLATALRIKRDFPDLHLATIDGEFVSAEGIVFGGSSTGQSESLLARTALITTLATECEALEAERRALVARREDAAAITELGVQSLAEARDRHQAAQQTHSQATLQILAVERALRDAEQKLANVENERSTLEQQIRHADERIAQIEKEAATNRHSLAEQQTRREAAEQARENARLQEEDATVELNELRLAVATERQRHESLLNQRQPMAARQAELTDLVAARRADIATYQARLAVQARESEDAEARIEAQRSELVAAEKTLESLATRRSTHAAAVNQHDSELRRSRNALDDLRDSRAKQEVRQTQLQLRIDNIAEHVARRYQIDLRTFEADAFAFRKTLGVMLRRRSKPVDTAGDDTPTPAPDEPTGAPLEVSTGELEAIIADLTRQLDGMGPVNLEAVHEYDELEERHRFLETQNNDLTAARKEVLDVIARINSTTQKLFTETFAQVRINFREMFGEMFDGGRADLSLVDENDPLNCGIEIIAKPPGKQLQSVSLLSGGERTMTAVALLFAIYMVRPSPFCILDEMDAPLDESNINRFIRVLERFVTQSQFIIITHNKRTIAKADVLYGVTMEERGVSKLVGMKLAADRGSDGELRRSDRKGSTRPQFAPENGEHERELALGR